ncbi:hypothetical protein KVT40_008396 [Elsinoe batatas]|uniref:SWIM-type domain-containing protein n=1 Tax=Elsinoe batatas TaxID=2601811 RepID=A0A8K0KU93_9PEZI|nr:hypothetical protein KVT40_008396 [Elsinoe batatas]
MLTKRSLLTSLINTLSALPTADALAANPLKSFATSPEIKNVFFSLHVLFPAELLSALDLLDRGMVHRLLLSSDTSASAETAHQDTTSDPSTIANPASTDTQSGPQMPPSTSAGSGGTKKVTYLVSSTLPSSRPHPTNRFHRPHPSSSSSAANLSHQGPMSTHAPTPTYRPTSTYLFSSIASRLHDPLPDSDGPTDTGLDEAARFHHVRVEGWWCGCPAYAFALFPSCPPTKSDVDGAEGGGRGIGRAVERFGEVQGRDACRGKGKGFGMGRGVGEGKGSGEGEEWEWEAGGLLRGREVPMCKHLLACLLVERCGGLFGGFVKEREVGLEEWVGWAAGWGG